MKVVWNRPKPIPKFMFQRSCSTLLLHLLLSTIRLSTSHSYSWNSN